MKNLLIFVIALCLISCGGNEMEKDAKKLAKLTLKMSELSKKVSSGDKSVLSEATDVGTKVAELTDELQKKYSSKEDEDKFSAIYLKAYGDLNGNQSSAGENENKDGLKDDSGKDSSSDLTNQTKEILKKYTFSKITSLTSLIVISFDDSNFTFRVLATNGTELSRANGSYQISQASDGSIAKIDLDREGPVQKSPAYADNQGIDTEVFLLFNKELLLKEATQDLLSHFSAMDMMTMKDNVPEFFLVGRDAFTSRKILTQAEKDSIDNQKRLMEEKKANLEEKLKGF
jgi:hypothetical protein